MSQSKMQPYLWAIDPAYLESLLHSAHNRAEVLTTHNALVFEQAKPNFTGQKAGNMAVILLHGAIYRSSQARVKRELDEALADTSVQSIMLHINSPGGLVSGTKELADFIYASRKIKPMAAYIDGLCASAAMWIASAVGSIYAPTTANLGSIGVISVLPNYNELNKNWGVDYTYIKAGKWKAVGNSDFAPTAEEKEYLQERINALHEIFKADIERNLNLKCHASLWNDAQIFLANDAKDMGFVKAIVQDFSEACIKFQKQENKKMDKETLAKEHPEIYQAIFDEGKSMAVVREENNKAVEQPQAENTKSNTSSMLMDLLATLLPSDQHARVQNIVKACDASGIPYDKASALASLLATANKQNAQNNQPENAQADNAQSEILARLQGLSLDPIGTVKGVIPNPQQKSALLADAEKRTAQ